MILPKVQEIPRSQAVELQRQWQLAAAEQAKAREASPAEPDERR